jgi:hypothetical protein
MKKDFNDVNVLWDELIENELFTWDELRLLTNINGYSVETLNDAIFSRYGYRDYEQMMGE